MEVEVEKAAFTPMSSVPNGQRTGESASDLWGLHGAGVVGVVLVLSFVLLLAILLSASLGAVKISMRALILAGLRIQPLSDLQHTILFEIRLPRILASALVGAALALAGLMFQGLFRNPMADPYIIGASGGATVGACAGILFLAQYSLFGFSATALLAFAGAVLTMLVVYWLARTRGQTSGVTLLLAGFAVGTMLTNSTYLFDLFDPNPAYGHAIVGAWLHGVIGVPEWRQLGVMAMFFATASVAAYPLMRRLNTLALGDEYAHLLGIRVEATRIGIILVGSLLTAAAVSLGGLISFAGLIVPHVVRLILGPDHVRLLPITALAGAIFLVLTDTLARLLFAPTEIPVGVLMAFLGAPFFLYLLRKTRRAYVL